MENISLDKEAIELAVGTKYIVIDALYINDLKLEVRKLNSDDILNEIKRTVFPYTDTPFAEFIPEGTLFTLDRIKKVGSNQLGSENGSVFSTDSGTIVFVNEKVFTDFILRFDFDELSGSPFELLDLAYWHSVSGGFDLTDCAIIIAPGVNSGVDFEGSGTYRIA